MIDPSEHIRVDRESSVPLESQIAHQLTQMIAAGMLGVGTRLPTMRQLAVSTGVNLHTVRAAYSRLESQGLVEMTRGRGTSVVARDLPGFVRGDGARSFNIGVLLPALSSFYRPVVSGMTSAVDGEPSGLVYAFADERRDAALDSVRRFLATGVDGVVVVSQTFDEGVVFDQSPMPPFVFADWPGAPGHSVIFDPSPFGELVAHIAEHGHRSMALICPPRHHPNIGPLVRAYSETCLGLGLEDSARSVHEVPGWSSEHGATSASSLLDTTGRPTALIAATDELALGVYRAAGRLGLRVGIDLAVAGHGGMELGALVEPGLSTVILPAKELGRQAMVMLLGLTEGAAVPRMVRLTGRIALRGSCGCTR